MTISHLRQAPPSIDHPTLDLATHLLQSRNQIDEIQKLFSNFQQLLTQLKDSEQSNQNALNTQKRILEEEVFDFKKSTQQALNSLQEKKRTLEHATDSLSILIDREIVNRRSFLEHLQESLNLQLAFYFQKKYIEINDLEQNISLLKKSESDFHEKIKELESKIHSWEQKLSQTHQRFFSKEDPYEPLKREMRKALLKCSLYKAPDPAFDQNPTLF